MVLVVVDQLGSWVLAEHAERLEPAGFLRRAMRTGAYHRRVSYPYAATYTAPGHATLVTGKTPSETGILSNERFDEQLGQVPWMIDPSHPVLDAPGHSASPLALKSDTVGDALEQATGGRAKVFSISLKDRAAIVSGGKRADLALWYDAKIPGFTTSSYYAEALPECAARHRVEHPIRGLLTPWTPDRRDRLESLGSDDRPGEGSYQGWDRSFPHEPALADAPYAVLKLTPQLTDSMLELAGRCANELSMGEDAVPDLLVLSISSPDYTGHVFGPRSWEYVDVLRRADLALSRLFAKLSARTSLAVVVSSDHGVTPLPTDAGGRISSEPLVREISERVSEQLGPGRWVSAFVAPYVTLGADAQGKPEALTAVREALRSQRAIFAVFETARAGELRSSKLGLERSVGLSIDADPPGELFVVPRPGFIVDPDMARGEGTSHGSPWAPDRDVFVLASGVGVARVEGDTALDARRVAASLAALLGLPWEHAPPLPGIGARN